MSASAAKSLPRLTVWRERLAICRLEPASSIPSWALGASGFLSCTRTSDELSIVCAAAQVPAGVRVEDGFQLLKLEGPLPFDAVGIIARVTATLAGAGVSVIPVGTFDTDYLLVHDASVPRAIAALRGDGYTVELSEATGPANVPAPDYRSITRAEAASSLQRLADSNAIGAAILSREGDVREANHAFLAMIGRERTDLERASLTWQTLLAANDNTSDEHAIAELRTRRTATPYETNLLRADGGRVPVLLVLAASSGEARGDVVLCFAIDVTERRRAERAMRESQRRFQVMANASPLLVWTAGSDGQRTFFNERWTSFTGRTLDREYGQGWLQAVHPEDVRRVERTIEAAAAAGEQFRMEYRLRHDDGEYHWVLEYGVPIHEGGRFHGFTGSAVDITHRRHAEQLRENVLARERQARAEAERLSQLKDEFLGTLSHELRTPLNAILGWTQVLRRHRPADLDAALDVVARNARALTELVDDLLDVSHIVAGTIRLHIQPVDLHAVVADAVASLQPAATARGIVVRCNISPEIPLGHADSGRLRQIIWNLVSNAIKFTPWTGRVDVAAEWKDGQLAVSVEDTGEGIAQDFLPFVFERFSQADGSTSRRYGGLGLGLAIVRHLTELHGGTVTAESSGINRGSRFMVRLPWRPVDDQREPSAAS